MIERSVESGDGIVFVTSTGDATRADIDAHYDALRDIVATIRAAGRPVRVLSDQTAATRLSRDLNLHIRAQIERTYRPGDRVALVMATPDDKMYARQILGATEHAVFSSRIAAEMWLMERSLPPPGRQTDGLQH